MSGNEWEQGRAYVKRLRSEGHVDEEIRQIMLEGGWSGDRVERLLTLEAPPATSGARAQDDASERYHEIAETVGLIPSVRARDNLIQGIVVGVGALIGAGLGALSGGLIEALVGALVGLIIFTFISGFVLMIVGGSRAIKRRAGAAEEPEPGAQAHEAESEDEE